MKLVSRIPLLAVTITASLMTSATWAAGPGGSPYFRHARYSESQTSASRLTRESSPSPGTSHEPEQVATPETTGETDFADDGMYDGSDGGEGCCNGGCGWIDGRFKSGLWYGSVDYLLVCPRLSQGLAENRRTLITNGGTAAPTSSTLVDQSIAFPFRYNSSFRAALGYRLLDCGGDIQFAYWRLTGNAQVTDGPSDVTGGTRIISGLLENNTQGDNQFFSANSGVTANIFDIDFAKCLALGGPRDPCDACFCPRWDLRWSAGVRVGDVSRFNNNAVSDANGNAISVGNIDARFVGAGPRVGVQGRRYFGCNGMLSLYAKGSQALLIGDFRTSRVKTVPGIDQAPTEITQQFDRYSRMVPVTDIEIGGSWQVAPYTFISAGWFFQCWWDLGQGEVISGTNFGSLDTANILGFDGLFVRGEMLF